MEVLLGACVKTPLLSQKGRLGKISVSMLQNLGKRVCYFLLDFILTDRYQTYQHLTSPSVICGHLVKQLWSFRCGESSSLEKRAAKGLVAYSPNPHSSAGTVTFQYGNILV
jgi:hypothetical protein